jgi:hypothetical protein
MTVLTCHALRRCNKIPLSNELPKPQKKSWLTKCTLEGIIYDRTKSQEIPGVRVT